MKGLTPEELGRCRDDVAVLVTGLLREASGQGCAVAIVETQERAKRGRRGRRRVLRV